jgi:nicotinate phosphoribosyltransferase
MCIDYTKKEQNMINTMEETKKRTGRKLPEQHEPYADKYFLRTREILAAENINPWVRAQVFIRKGPGIVGGIDEAIDILRTYSPIEENDGRVYALRDGQEYKPNETLMIIEAPIQDIVALETMYLGVISAETTKATDKRGIDLDAVRKNMAAVVNAAAGRPVSYFGARHWRFDKDAAIAYAAYKGGATSASTDIGAETFNQAGIGTSPHVLENIMAWKYGYEKSVPETMKAFDRVIDRKVPRIILVDYRNREITDALATAEALEGRLNGVRIDTCGENVAEGGLRHECNITNRLVNAITIPEEDKKYWFGRGVTVTGVYAMRKNLDAYGYGNVKITLSSGFANPKKVAAFVRAEQILGMKLFDALGVGQVFESRAAKTDIVAVGETPETMVPISKTGRFYRPNPRLELRIGGVK